MKRLTRREMLRLWALVGAGTPAAACGATTAIAPTVPTSALAPTLTPAAADTAEPAIENTPTPEMTDTAESTAADITESAATDTTAPTAGGSSPEPNPPGAPVRLIFIHHSVGENLLKDDSDGGGGLGTALRDNNYFVSDTNYGWGPADADAGSETIGDHTDIGQWWTWFRGPHRDTYLASLYAEGNQNCSYSRLESGPDGENSIVLFKSCFPNSYIGGNPAGGSAGDDNPLRGEGSSSEWHTVANIKGIYNDLLAYFATRPDKLFVKLGFAALSSNSTDDAHAANARAVADWLVNDWLKGYPQRNVAVFDLFNVLTTNGGDTDTNDLNQEAGNHHRWWQGAVQHMNGSGNNFLAYWSGDDHPSQAGSRKATGEFVPLLNYFYNRWQAGSVALNGITNLHERSDAARGNGRGHVRPGCRHPRCV